MGSAMAAFGALGVLLGPALGFATLDRPWSFLLGSLFGVVTGVGFALALAGLIDGRSR
jgi:hypothetical protein